VTKKVVGVFVRFSRRSLANMYISLYTKNTNTDPVIRYRTITAIVANFAVLTLDMYMIYRVMHLQYTLCLLAILVQ
jgi:multisubunit Na+/H+ antiporter MnhC subunit